MKESSLSLSVRCLQVMKWLSSSSTGVEMFCFSAKYSTVKESKELYLPDIPASQSSEAWPS